MIIIVEPTPEWRRRYRREIQKLKRMGLQEDVQVWEEEGMTELFYVGAYTLVFVSTACLGCYPFLKNLCDRRKVPEGMEAQPVFGVTHRHKQGEQIFTEIAKQDGWQAIGRHQVIGKILDIVTS